jgi:hypothetical protein
MRRIADYTLGLIIVIAHFTIVAWRERRAHIHSGGA